MIDPSLGPDDSSDDLHREQDASSAPPAEGLESVPVRPVLALSPTFLLSPLPSSISPTSRPLQTVIVPTDRAVMSLIETVLDRAGVSQAEVARRLGIKFQSINQYRTMRRKRPSVQWLARLVMACGGKLIVEFPR